MLYGVNSWVFSRKYDEISTFIVWYLTFKKNTDAEVSES